MFCKICSCSRSQQTSPSPRRSSPNVRRSWPDCTACLSTSTSTTSTESWASGPSLTSTPATSISTTLSRSSILSTRKSLLLFKRWHGKYAQISLLPLHLQVELPFFCGEKIFTFLFQNLTSRSSRQILEDLPVITETFLWRYSVITIMIWRMAYHKMSNDYD